jgi:N-acetylmuramoyl-L-alanine amidase
MMKRLLAVFSLTLLLLMPVFVPTAAHAREAGRAYVAVVDPGHGGADSGVGITDNLSEKDVTLAIARSVQQELAAGKNIRVVLTRNGERTMAAPERIAAARAAKADVFISIHVNAGFGKEAAGYELYFPGFEGRDAAAGREGEVLQGMARNRVLNDSVRLAQAIERNMELVFPRKGRKLREAPVPVLQGLGLPGIVVEIGFATNLDESRKLADENTQTAVAQALARGMRQYFSTMGDMTP